MITTANIQQSLNDIKPDSPTFRLNELPVMSYHQFSFEKLEVWQLSRELTKDIYRHTTKFPREEKYLLTSQLRRAAISVASNLAEGSTRTNAKDKARFTTIAFSSLMEVFNQIMISVDLGYLDDQALIQYRRQIQVLSVKLSNLKASQLKGISRIGLIFWSLFIPALSRQLTPLS